jgi:hypothetical protein
MMQFRTLLLLSSAVALAACDGATDVASPGEGVIVIPAPTPTPVPTPTPTPTPTPPTTGPAAGCPEGTANVGVINNLRNCQISGNIIGNRVIQNLPGTVYSLSGRVNVGLDLGADPAAPIAGGARGVLTIEEGTVLFGSSGADSLVVNRGSQIFAEGSATRPIIFTSRTNMEGFAGVPGGGESAIGQWGGIVILGRAPTNNCTGTGSVPGTINCQRAVEGLTGAFFGGASVNDDSGRIRYVQVRYPGFEVAPGNELNGITLGGVGRGTTFNHVQIHNSSDDGIEWFGGRVNSKYLVMTGIDDDSIDTDDGFKGFIQFALVVQRSSGGDRVIEADTGGNGLRTPRTNVRLSNFTFVNRRTPDPILLRGGTDFTLINGVISATAANCLDIDEINVVDGVTIPPPDGTIRERDDAIDDVGPPIFRSILFGGCANSARDEADIPRALITPLITGNGNQLAPLTLSLTSDFLPGTVETGAAAADPRTFNSVTVGTTEARAANSGGDFVEAAYVGAFRNATDRWYAGWTCGLGDGTPACTVAPANTAVSTPR